MRKTIYVPTMDIALWEATEELAQKRGQSVSHLIVLALNSYVRGDNSSELNKDKVIEYLRSHLS